MARCRKCGRALPEGSTSCPYCGGTKDTSGGPTTKISTDYNAIGISRNDEAERTLYTLAESILSYFDTLGNFGAAGLCLIGILIVIVGSNIDPSISIGLFVLCIAFAVGCYFGCKFIGKVLSSFITTLANISSTLKLIERKIKE